MFRTNRNSHQPHLHDAKGYVYSNMTMYVSKTVDEYIRAHITVNRPSGVSV